MQIKERLSVHSPFVVGPWSNDVILTILSSNVTTVIYAYNPNF